MDYQLVHVPDHLERISSFAAPYFSLGTVRSDFRGGLGRSFSFRSKKAARAEDYHPIRSMA